MDNNKLINIKKIALDHLALRVGFPYVVWYNHMRIYASYVSGNSSALKFNYFNSKNEYCELVLDITDEFEIMPMTSNTEAVAFKDYDDMVKNIDLTSKMIESWHKGDNDDI
jgi:hypothetical protein